MENPNQNAIRALLDIYKQAIAELKNTVQPIDDLQLVIIVDSATWDENCKSVQTILAHVVHSGFGYANSIYNSKFPHQKRRDKVSQTTTRAFLKDLDSLYNYTETVFFQLTDDDLEQKDNALKIKTGWDQLYDIEQLMEHAIVHILRHQRQIERFKRQGVV